MKKKSVFLILTALAFLCAVPAEAQTLSVWTLDVHSKYFADTKPDEGKTLTLSSASNEYESAQFALRADVDLDNVEVTATDLVCEENGQKLDASIVRIRRIGMLHITKNTPNADAIVVRKAPCDIPEILYDENVLYLKANETAGVWITTFVPKGTRPGQYTGKIIVKNNVVQEELSIILNVFPFELPDKRSLYITNWWHPQNYASHHNVKYLSEEYWSIVEKYIQNMGEHRQNVLLIRWTPSVGDLVECVKKNDGTFEFDFTKFERLISLAEKYGVADRIELGHIGGIDRTTHCVNFSSATVRTESGENVTLSIDEWLEPSLIAVCDYLKKTGRMERAMIHVADEPYLPDIDSWREASKRVRDIAPDLKQIDAIETMNFTERLDVWVPKLSHYDRWRKAFEQRRGNNEYWYYICCHPVGVAYPNRFMDLPSTRIRVLHWLNYSDNLAGYLHWGFNFWSGDAFGPPTEMYGPGDTHVVYPGPNGPLDSIRWELERESVEDYEYLKLLENSVAEFKASLDQDRAWAIDPESRSMELARRIVPDLANSTMDQKLIEQTRQDLANEIICATSEPKLVVQTFPEDGKVIYSGPNLVEVYGFTTPGSKVTINDEEQNVEPDGFFKKLFFADNKGEMNVRINATLGEKTVQTTRCFLIK